MKITILYGSDYKQTNDFSAELRFYITEFLKDFEVDFYNLDELKLNFCIGCWTCWRKTPGLCVHKDDADAIFRSVISSDFLIFASPISTGFIGSNLKKIIDRLIILLHPYITFINNESHHKKRYEKYPNLALLLKKEEDTDNEDISIINQIFDRFAINFHSKHLFIELFDKELTVQNISNILTNLKSNL